MPDGFATAHLYRPKLVTLIAEGYSFDAFRREDASQLPDGGV
jgi:SulP family sulfate permease